MFAQTAKRKRANLVTGASVRHGILAVTSIRFFSPRNLKWLIDTLHSLPQSCDHSEMGDFNGENYKDTFIAELVTFVADESFQAMFESFFIEHAMQFSSAEEHELHYYEIYQKFHGMFEGQLEGFCSRANVTQSEFMVQCRLAREKDERAKRYIDILLSSVEYETFVKLMKIMRPVAESRLSSTADPKVLGNHIRSKDSLLLSCR